MNYLSQVDFSKLVPANLSECWKTPESCQVNKETGIAAGAILAAGLGLAVTVAYVFKASKSVKARNAADAAVKAQEAARQAALIREQQEAAAAERQRQLQSCERVQTIDARNKAIAATLGLTQVYLPLEWPSYAGALGFKGNEKPVAKEQFKLRFEQDKQQELDFIANTIKVVLAGNSGLALPNLVIEGEKGTGKSRLVEHLMQETGVGYIIIPKTVFENHIINGTHIQAFHDIQKMAMSSSAPVYLVIEDSEELFSHRSLPTTEATGQQQSPESRIVEQRRVELVNAFLDVTGDDNRKVSILMTTRHPEKIDHAFNTRNKPIELKAPGSYVRRAIIADLVFRIFKGDATMARFFNLARIERMANETDNFTGSDLEVMMKKISDIVTLKQRLGQSVVDQGTVDSTIEQMKALKLRERQMSEAAL